MVFFCFNLLQIMEDLLTYHTCAVLDDGSVKCWGYGRWGQLGNGNSDNVGDRPNGVGDNLTAVDLGQNGTASYIVLGGFHTCAILKQGNLKCWGYNAGGQLGY